MMTDEQRRAEILRLAGRIEEIERELDEARSERLGLFIEVDGTALAARIRQVRLKRGLRVGDFRAKVEGLAPFYVKGVEQGLEHRIREGALQAIARALDCSTSDLLPP